MDPISGPIQLAVAIPNGLPESRIYAHISILGGECLDRPKRGLLVFLTAATKAGMAVSSAPMGGLVCALPYLNSADKKIPHSTFLCGSASNIDINTSIARILAGRLQRPIHLGSSLNLDEVSGNGGDALEQMKAMNLVVSMIVKAVTSVEEKYAAYREKASSNREVDGLSSSAAKLEV